MVEVPTSCKFTATLILNVLVKNITKSIFQSSKSPDAMIDSIMQFFLNNKQGVAAIDLTFMNGLKGVGDHVFVAFRDGLNIKIC